MSRNLESKYFPKFWLPLGTYFLFQNDLKFVKTSLLGDITFKVSTDAEVYTKQEGTYQCVGGAQGSRFRVASEEADLSIAKLEDFTGGPFKNDLIEVYEGNDIGKVIC